MNVAQYLAHWLDQVRVTMRPNSRRNYEQQIRLHINPAIGQVKLAKLTPLHIQRLYTAMATEGYAPNTIKLTHAALYMALGQAVEWEMMPRNAAAKVAIPRVPKRSSAPCSATRT
jgi:integrase